MKLVAAVAYLH